MTERYSAATNTFHTQRNNPIPLSFVSQNSYKIHQLGRTLFYIYIYISRFSRCSSKRAATVGGHRAKAEEEGTPAGRCCLADCVVGKKRGRSSGREGKRAEVALIINNPLLRRGCSAFVLGLVRGPGSPSVPGIPPPSLTLTCNAATGAPTIRMTIH